MKMEDYRIDNQKLIYHPKRVSDWLEGKDIYPIYIEISPCSVCNHRCIFCAFDYLGHKPVYLDKDILKKFIKDIAKTGVKSILFSGEGEPLLHKDIVELVVFSRKNNLDAAITANGALLSMKIAKQIIPNLKWIRFSFNAATAKTYSLIHKTKSEDFYRVIDNIKKAIDFKRKNGYECTIGVQFLLLNENYREAHRLARILKDIEADYLIIKPYSQHPLSINRLKVKLDYGKFLFLEEELRKYTANNFEIIFRKNTMFKLKEQRPYKKCLGMPFYAYLSSGGDLYGCSAFLGDSRFCYGNIYKNSFEEIWNGAKRKRILKMMSSDWDINNCREVCRLDEINRYLWQLKMPPAHLNFI